MTYTISTLIDTSPDSWNRFKRVCKKLKSPIRKHIAVVVDQYVESLGKEGVVIFPLGTVFGIAARGEMLIKSVMKRRKCSRPEAQVYILSLLNAGDEKLEKWLMRSSSTEVCRYMVPKVHGKAGRPKKAKS
jgi:tRNA A37 threonylcarbamoyladenosine synthetase subunit TsaC/SUA5/YrdC